MKNLVKQNGWKAMQMSEVVQINPRPGKDELQDEILASFIPMKCVEEESGRFIPLEDRKVVDVRKGYTPFRDGDVIFAKVTPCMENGKAAVMKGLTNGIGFGSTEFFTLRPKDNLDANYLLHFILQSSFRREAARNMTGAVGLRRVPKSYLEQQRIPLPPLDEQRRIVAEIEKQFTRLDAGVAALQRVQAKLKRYRASVLKSACEGRLVPTESELARAEGRDYEPAKVLLQRILTERREKWNGRGKYKEPATPDIANLSELPEGWVWASIDQMYYFDSGHAFKKSDYSDSGYKLLQIANVDFGKTLWEQQNFLPERFATEYSELILQEGEIVMALNRPIIANNLKIALISESDRPAILYQRVGRLKPVSNLTTKYFFAFAQSDLMLKGVRERLRGTDQPYINTSLVPDIPVPLPPLAEQERIVAEVERRLSVIDELQATVTANLQRATRLRQSILQKAFSGNLVSLDAP